MLSLSVSSETGSWAGSRPGRTAEWPPAPADVIGLLAAGAAHEADRAAVRWLEGAGEPHVWLRDRGHACAFVWPEAEPGDAVVDALHRLSLGAEPASRRSTVRVEVTAGRRQGPSGPWRLHGAAGRTQNPLQRITPLRRAQIGPFGDLLVWGLAKPVGPVGGEQAARLGQAFRRAVIARTPDPVPPQISGHGAEGRPHAAYLTLPEVDRPHAAGRVRGLALAVPQDLPVADLRTLEQGVLQPPLETLAVDRRWPLLHLGRETGGVRELQPQRWTAAPYGARRWATATPMLADGRLRRGREPEELVVRSLTKAGYPHPVDVTCSPAPLLEGAPWRPAAGTVPERCRGLPRLHARVTFEQPLLGPLLAGAMRYFGLGLFLPETDDTERD